MQKLSKKAQALVAVFVSASIIAGAAVFQPWKLFIDTEVQEQIPTVQGPTPSGFESADSGALEHGPTEPGDVEPDATETTKPITSTPKTSQPESQAPITLAQGSLISHEHGTSGTVKILELADGSRVLRLEDLDTSDGPKLEVWLTDAPVIAGQGGWFVFDDGKYRSLGALKGNKGNQNYEIPANVNLSDFSSVSIWCVAFKVSFGAAELIKQ